MTDIVELARKIKNLQELHTGYVDKTIIIFERSSNGDKNLVEINDKRLNDLIFDLWREAVNEMRSMCPEIKTNVWI